MDLTLAGVAVTVIEEGIKFLYDQGSELLGRWQEQKGEGKEGAKPKLVPVPKGVTVGNADPLRQPVNDAMRDALIEMRKLIGTISKGDLGRAEAREAVANMRDLVEAAIGTDITFLGEQPRSTFGAKDVQVTVHRVAGRVAGVRANLGKLPGTVSFGNIALSAGDVDAGGDVAGVDLS